MMGGKLSLVFAATALLVSCSTVATTRNLPIEQLPTLVRSGDTLVKSSQSLKRHVQDVRVNVPDTLTVSEANSFIPSADLVWRGDPYGDRRAQIKDIIDLAASQAAIGLRGMRAVYLDINVKRFHALSQKARATLGGTHAIFFDVTIRDVATNMVLVDPVPIEIKLRALGGQKAINAEMRGDTQKVRISREIVSVMRQYLGA